MGNTRLGVLPDTAEKSTCECLKIMKKVIAEPMKNSAARKHAGLFLLRDTAFDVIYGESERCEIAQNVNIYAPQMNRERLKANLAVLKDADVIFSGWGCPIMDDEFLDAAPNLKAVFYAAGAIRYCTDKGQIFDRGIIITSSFLANAIPVAEFCLSQILFSLKLGWHFALEIKKNKIWPPFDERYKVHGAFGSTVGLISLGAISRKLIELLKLHDVNILVSSGHLEESEARQIGVRKASVEEIFQTADVVSLHTPGSHKGVVCGDHIRMMKKRATFLNTARGACVKEREMIEALKERPDIMALLDITDPEPPIAGSELFELPNVITFPHISGSMHGECRRMARFAIDDYHRFCKGENLKYQVSRKEWEHMS